MTDPDKIDSWEIVGYMDKDRERHYEPPPATAEPDGWFAVQVHAWNSKDEEEEKTWWIYHPVGFQDWQEILSLIGHSLGDYGIEMA